MIVGGGAKCEEKLKWTKYSSSNGIVSKSVLNFLIVAIFIVWCLAISAGKYFLYHLPVITCIYFKLKLHNVVI